MNKHATKFNREWGNTLIILGIVLLAANAFYLPVQIDVPGFFGFFPIFSFLPSLVFLGGRILNNYIQNPTIEDNPALVKWAVRFFFIALGGTVLYFVAPTLNFKIFVIFMYCTFVVSFGYYHLRERVVY